jgi:hypothetical protein
MRIVVAVDGVVLLVKNSLLNVIYHWVVAVHPCIKLGLGIILTLWKVAPTDMVLAVEKRAVVIIVLYVIQKQKRTAHFVQIILLHLAVLRRMFPSRACLIIRDASR